MNINVHVPRSLGIDDGSGKNPKFHVNIISMGWPPNVTDILFVHIHDSSRGTDSEAMGYRKWKKNE